MFIRVNYMNNEVAYVNSYASYDSNTPLFSPTPEKTVGARCCLLRYRNAKPKVFCTTVAKRTKHERRSKSSVMIG